MNANMEMIQANAANTPTLTETQINFILKNMIEEIKNE